MTQSNFRSIWKMKNRVVVNWSRITGLKITENLVQYQDFFYFHIHLKLLKDIRPVDKHAGIIWRRPADEALISNLGASCWSLPKLPSDQQVMPIKGLNTHNSVSITWSSGFFWRYFFFHFMENNLISLKPIFRFCVLLWFSNVYWKEWVFYLSLVNLVM